MSPWPCAATIYYHPAATATLPCLPLVCSETCLNGSSERRIISPARFPNPIPVQVEAQGPVPETVAFHGISHEQITPGKLNTTARWMITVDDLSTLLRNENQSVYGRLERIPDPELVEAGKKVIECLLRVQGK